MLLANFNLANTCVPHVTLLRTNYARKYAQAHVFGGINFGDLVRNLPIRKIPAKVSGYTVAVEKYQVFSPQLQDKMFEVALG